MKKKNKKRACFKHLNLNQRFLNLVIHFHLTWDYSRVRCRFSWGKGCKHQVGIIHEDEVKIGQKDLVEHRVCWVGCQLPGARLLLAWTRSLMVCFSLSIKLLGSNNTNLLTNETGNLMEAFKTARVSVSLVWVVNPSPIVIEWALTWGKTAMKLTENHKNLKIHLKKECT